MALRGALRRTSTWFAAHAPWSAWAWRNTAFAAAAIPPALPVLAGVTVLSVLPGDGPVPLAAALAALVLCPLLTPLQRSRFRSLLGLHVPPVVREHRWWTPRGAGERLGSGAMLRQYGYHLIVGPLTALAGAAVVLAWAAGAVGATVYGWVWLLPGPGGTGAPGWTGQCDVVTVAGALAVLAAPWAAALVARLDALAASALLGPSRAA